MRYSIFNYHIESNIPLPELQKSNNAPPTLFFNSTAVTSVAQDSIEWSHHWRLPDGQISISVGKEKDHYWLRFPELVDFKLNSETNQITAYRHGNIPDNTVRHLLLDQVIPRLLSHQGQLIIHASCIQIGNSVIAFCGGSGWGKSTLAAYFYKVGYTLITDDCLLLETNDSKMKGTPNYQGLRLFDDSLSLLSDSPTEPTTVCHYALKKRITISEENQIEAVPVAAIFFLTDPKKQGDHPSSSIKPIARAPAIIDLLKHCFPLDITDSKRTSKQLINLAELIKNSSTQFYRLKYARTIQSLPGILEMIIKTSDIPIKNNTL